MKYISSTVIIIIFCQIAMAIENPSVSSATTPISSRGTSATVPVSTYNRSTHKSPSEARFANRNLVVTGNVGGGRHFRGYVPYNAATQFGDQLGTDSLYDFLRRSSYNPYTYEPAQAQPFFLPSRTGTTLERAGTSGLKTPNVRRPQYLPPIQQTSTSGLTSTLDRSVQPRAGTAGAEFSSSRELVDYFRRKNTAKLYDPELADLIEARYEQIMEFKKQNPELESEINTGQTPETELESELSKKDKDVKTPEPARPAEPFEPVEPEDPAVADETDPLRDSRHQNNVTQNPASEIIESHQQRVGQEKKLLDELLETVKDRDTEKTKADLEAATKPQFKKPNLSHKEVQEILGEHKTFESYAKAKTEHYVKVANEFMEARAFYKAADAYRLAEIFEPDSMQIYKNKAHALFAAGEYLSASYNIRKAISLDPKAALERVEIIPLMGSKDLFDRRLQDIMIYYKEADSPELSLLLAYVLYNADRFEEATVAVNNALKAGPEDPVAAKLKERIEYFQARW
jgi:tetratricopeptide (TPR) repeat protein